MTKSPNPLLLILAFLLLFIAGSGRAEMYKWVDSSGKMHLTDNLFNVPQEYLNQITTYQESKPPSSDGDIPLTKTESGYVLPVLVNGTEIVKLLLDTGANTTVIAPRSLKRAGFDPRTEQKVVVRTAGGEVNASTVEIQSLAVGGFKRGPMRVVSHEAVPGYDGLLGMDFLGAYRFEILTSWPKLRLNLP